MNPYATAATAILAPAFGFQCGEQIANILSMTPDQMPDWMHWLLGPFGALVGAGLILYWFMQRSKQSEEKLDKYHEELRRINERAVTAIEQCKGSIDTMVRAQEAHTEELRQRR